ncbi:MAG: ABC transporter ATP-binding protein [bacterium]|nr:ABC transporter ATP-binding protein [bacterium]
MGIFGGIGADKYDRQYADTFLFRRFGVYLRPHRRSVIAIIGLVMLFALIGALIPVTISAALEAMEGGGSDLFLFIGALFAIAILDYGIFWVRRRLTARVIGDVIGRLRKDAYHAALQRDMVFYDETKSGKVVSRITSDTQELSQVLLIGSDILSQLGEFIFLFLLLINYEWRLTLILLCLTPIVVGTMLVFRRLARTATRQGSRAMALVNDNIQESVTGISVAKNFRREAMIYREFADVNQQSYRINFRRGFVLATVFPTQNFLAGFAIATLVYVGASFVIGGSITAASWFLFIQAQDRFWFPFINLSAFWSQLQGGLSAMERIFALIDAENTVIQTDHRPAPELHGKIEFDQVVFRYSTGDPVLNDFNLTIQPGESIAFVGHTGAGKSTIARLIARFYEFQEGQIRVDGQDIRTFDLASYRSRLGIVPQQPFLFNTTVMENIRYARPEATDAEIEAIAHSIGGGEWLETLPDGLQSEVGERGSRLSMGQRQLVSLLRVLVQKPSIFILDEATASIDPFTEMQIQEALDLILKRSTSILIAHRLSTVRTADRIIVLKQGRIIEQGSHGHLMQMGGHYAELYNTYFRHQSLDYVEHAKQALEAEPGSD